MTPDEETAPPRYWRSPPWKPCRVHGDDLALWCLRSFVLDFNIQNHTSWSQVAGYLAMFCVTLATFILATIYWSAYLGGFATQVRGILVDTDIGPLDTGSFDGINKKGLPFANLENWASQLLPMIGDAVVVWRAWVLYDEQRLAMVGPVALLAGTIGSGLGFLGFSSSEKVNIVGGIGGSVTRKNTFVSFSALSLATNVITTALIVYKIWSRGQPAGSVGVGAKNIKPSRLLSTSVLLVEAGILYAATQVINLVLELVRSRPDSSLYFGERVVTAVYTLCTAMYPTIVVILVITQRSITNIYGFIAIIPKKTSVDIRSAGARTATAGHLSFARAPPAAGTQISAVTDFSEDQSRIVSIAFHEQSEKVQNIVREMSNEDVPLTEKQTKMAPF
ncbi:hypothetical protein LshimejAT787_1100410 [Lyophyllum shimeji]|uniref:Uncharacterized protein n=1 Tax=Lyophyllum shimeji TaxID=47721 RepID=A0A9P3UTD1_LYOSH|nr:hypothetical protein LshimejAT787_1100410 [Lyophyllum shimeji]